MVGNSSLLCRTGLNIGKQVPYFVTKHFITQQVLAIAEREH
jgi:hypothetical protein